MADYEKWLAMSKNSFATGDLAMGSGDERSAVSRYYYAAYQAATAALLYRKLTLPIGREAWSHVDTPILFENDLVPVLRKITIRQKVSSRLRQLYDLRVNADYKITITTSKKAVEEARRIAGYIISTVEGILPQEQK